VRVIAAVAALGFILCFLCAVPFGFALGINPIGSLSVISEPFPVSFLKYISVDEAPQKILIIHINRKSNKSPFDVSWNPDIQGLNRNFGAYPFGRRWQLGEVDNDASQAMSISSSYVGCAKYVSEPIELQDIAEQQICPLGGNHCLSLKKSGFGTRSRYGNGCFHIFGLSFVDVQHGFDGRFRSGGASLGGSDSPSGIDQGAEDARDSDHAGRELIETPFGLFLDSYSGAPLYAVLCIIASFGGLAVWLVLGPRQHPIWIGGIIYVLATVAALGVAAAYYR